MDEFNTNGGMTPESEGDPEYGMTAQLGDRSPAQQTAPREAYQPEPEQTAPEYGETAHLNAQQAPEYGETAHLNTQQPAPVYGAAYPEPQQTAARSGYRPYPAQGAPYSPYYAPPQQPQPQYYDGYGPQPQPYYSQPAQTYAPQQQYQAPQQSPSDIGPNPYLQNTPQQAPAPQYYGHYAPAPEKPRMSTGAKAYLIILTALMVAMVVGFIIYVAYLGNRDKDKSNSSNDTTISVPGFNNDDNDKNNNGLDIFAGNSAEEFDEEITLVEDNGDTQKRDDNNPDSVGEPDEKAKLIELKALPKDKDNEKYTTQSAYDTVGDSVVTVELFEGEITENINDIKGMGTGTIISEDGYIVTNAHVIANSRAYAVKIIMNSGDSYQAKIIGYDTWTDLAVLKIEAEGLTPVEFGDSALIEIGQDVIAIGSPGGEKFQNSLTKGIVSAVDRELSINKYVRYIQSDAAISPGNSGGPLCNIYGQVIGINTAKTTATNYEAMTFSIPSDTVKEIVNELLRYGYVRGRTRIGFTGTQVSSEEQYYYGWPAGIVISDIDSTGSLAGTKIKKGDIITAIDGVEISTFQDIYAILNEHKPGDKLKISVYRASEN